MPPYPQLITGQGLWPEKYFDIILAQLENGNRMVLPVGLDVTSPKRITFDGRSYKLDREMYIWVSNQERKNIIRDIKRITFYDNDHAK